MSKLNKIEELKRAIAPIDYDISSIDWHNLNEAQRFYLKNYGIYNSKLRPDEFMIRLRIDAGKIDLEKLEIISKIALEHNLKLLITARAQIELHSLSANNVWSIYKRLQSSGIETLQTLTDNFRAIITDPYDGVASDSFIECTPLIQKIQAIFLKRKEWMGMLPRKFNTAIIGRVHPITNPWSNDLLFALATKEGEYGFNIYLGGKNSEVAQSANIFITPKDAPKLFEAVANIFKHYGLRQSRAKTRLFHLIEKEGIESIRTLIENKFGSPLASEGTLLMQESQFNTTTALKNSATARIYATNFAQITPDKLLELTKLAKQHHWSIRLGSDQNLHIIPTLPNNQASHQYLHNSKTPLPLIACAGSRYCALSLWDVKEDSIDLPIERLAQLNITLGFSGCLKGCGRHYHSDIGLVGLRSNLYAQTEMAARIFIGAVQNPTQAPARMLYYTVPKRKLNALINTILDDFEASGFVHFGIFSQKVLNRYSIEFLQLWYLVRLLYQIDDTILEQFFKANNEESLKNKLLSFIDTEEGQLFEVIKKLSHLAWDKK